jgi:hypothetical protein
MPQFDIYLRNALQWGFRQVWAETPDTALAAAQRLIEDDPTGFEMFYDGEFCDTVTRIHVCESGSNDTLAAWRSDEHGLRPFAPELLAASETVVDRWQEGNLAEAVRRLATVIGRIKQCEG